MYRGNGAAPPLLDAGMPGRRFAADQGLVALSAVQCSAVQWMYTHVIPSIDHVFVFVSVFVREKDANS